MKNSAWRALNCPQLGFWLFDDTRVAVASHCPLLSFNRFTNLASVAFFACGLTTCTDPLDLGQFALDDVRVTVAVPEPETYALMAAGLLLLGAMRRRVR